MTISEFRALLAKEPLKALLAHPVGDSAVQTVIHALPALLDVAEHAKRLVDALRGEHPNINWEEYMDVRTALAKLSGTSTNQRRERSMNITDKHRVRGKVESVKGPHDNDHGGLSTWVHLELNSGWHQGFGGLHLDPRLADDYVRDLCVAFNVRGMDELVGKECFALYSFGDFNETIEGLESADTGRRFLHNSWRKKNFPEKTKSVYEQELGRVESEIAWAERRGREAKAKLVVLASKYVDWEKVK